MKNLFPLVIVLIIVGLSSCASVTKIGELNMASNRNIDSNTDYVRLTSYSGDTKQDMKKAKKAKSESIEEAVDITVKSVPGGEYLMNVKMYEYGKNKHYHVEGDVWGVSSEEKEHKGIGLGDFVLWEAAGGIKKGVVKALVDEKTCYIEREDGQLVEKKYTELSKVK